MTTRLHEIEITSGMIEAGEEALLSELGGAVSVYWRAMACAKGFICNRKAPSPSPFMLFRHRLPP